MTNRNTNSHFSQAPQVDIERSTFDRSTNVKTSFSVGELVPFFVDEILPGDTYRIETSKVMRLQTLITPVMDNLYLDTYFFFVPNRLVWENWEDFICGGIKAGWEPVVPRTVPMCIPPYEGSDEGDVNGWIVGTIADYMGIPPYQYDSTLQLGINALPFRCYAKIVEDWFKDENLQDPIYIYTGDSDTQGSNGGNYVTDLQAGGLPFIANKYHDYFTSCLLQPQKGPDVPFLDGYIPIVPRETGAGNYQLHDYAPTGNVPATHIRSFLDPHNGVGANLLGSSTSNNMISGDLEGSSQLDNRTNVYFSNLFGNLADAFLPGDYPTTSINTLRQAFQVQRLLEKDARSGTRYIELLQAHFQVQSPDARLQRAEYLGGNRVPFNIEQVLQTSSTDETTPQGNVAGWSQTNDTNYDVEKSFVEHGWIIGLMCARYDHTYQQGLEKQFQRYGRYDFYWPTLAHLGEKAVGVSEIYWNGMNQDTASLDYHFQIQKDHIFGYQEAWAEYRYKPNYVTGQMRSAYAQSLDFWHFADYYESRPYLSPDWLKEDKSNVDRTLAVSSEVADQIFGDIYVDVKATRPMPLYSIPGLIDHF